MKDSKVNSKDTWFKHNRSMHRRLLIANSFTGVSSLVMAIFVLNITDYINMNYTLFLLSDVGMIFYVEKLERIIFSVLSSSSPIGSFTVQALHACRFELSAPGLYDFVVLCGPDIRFGS
jgi:hypothetical protein